MTEEAKRVTEILHERGCRGCVVKEVTTCIHRERDEFCDNFYHDAADLIESLSAQLEQVTRERDAAMEDIVKGCHKCKHFKVLFNGCTPDYDCEYSDVCEDGDHWQWRGVEANQ